MSSLPVVDLSAARRGGVDLARQVAGACRSHGFFYLVGHGVDARLTSELAELGRRFFDQPDERKLEIAMERGGRAWRGFFPVGAELTLGQPDRKEGLYFGTELGSEHPAVQAGRPLHGPNQFPPEPDMRAHVLAYLRALEELGQRVLAAIARSLELQTGYFLEHYTYEPTSLLRVFHYPPVAPEETDVWNVAEHSDYGLLTLLWQDDVGGLQVRGPDGWLDVAPLEGSFVCNIGDMLERMTAGRYRSTRHRVRNVSGRSRVSVAFFLDPNFDARVRPLPLPVNADDRDAWDGLDVHAFAGTYGEYLVEKVTRVFPQLAQLLRAP